MPDLFGPGAAGAARAVTVRPIFTPLNQAPGDPDTWAKDCSTPALADGTEDRAAHMNMLLAQLRGVARRSQVTENSADDDLTARAVRSQRLNWLTPGGTANAITLTPNPAFASFTDLVGVPLRVLAAATNTSNVTLAVSGLTALALTRAFGDPLVAGDIVAARPFAAVYDGAAFRLLHPGAREYSLNVPSALVWVRTDGSDTNDGSANTAAGAFATINAAVAYASSRFNLAGRTLTVRLGAPGTFAGFSIQGAAGQITIVGDTAAPGSYVISGAQPGFVSGSNVVLQGLTLSNTATTNNTLEAAYGGIVTLDRVTLTGVASSNVATAHLAASPGGSIGVGGALTINSSQGAAFSARGGNVTIQTGVTVTFSGGPAFAAATATARGSGSAISANGATMSGSGTGTRFAVSGNGSIDVNGAGANFFPGSVAGTTATGGQYL